MTTIVIEVEGKEDLSAVKELADNKGLKYYVNDDKSQYSTEFKNMLEERYAQYKSGTVELVDQEESKKRVNLMLEAPLKK